MAAPQEIFKEKLAQQIIKALEKRRMSGTYAPTIAQAREEVAALIPDGSSVFRCGSTSLVEMGLWERLKANPRITVIDPYLPAIFTGRRPRGAPPGADGRLHDRQQQRHHARWKTGESGWDGEPSGGDGLWPQKSHPLSSA